MHALVFLTAALLLQACWSLVLTWFVAFAGKACTAAYKGYGMLVSSFNSFETVVIAVVGSSPAYWRDLLHVPAQLAGTIACIFASLLLL